MALDLAHAGCNVPAVTVSVHGSAFMMRVVDGAGRSAAVFFAGDVPAVPGILRLKRDAAASGSFDDEVSSADTVLILLREHGLFPPSLCPRRWRLAVVY